MYDDLRPGIAKAKAEEEQRVKAEEAAKVKPPVKAAAERLWTKSQPIVVGDRVRNCNAGAGTVTAIEQYTPEIVKCRVRFDVIFKGKTNLRSGPFRPRRCGAAGPCPSRDPAGCLPPTRARPVEGLLADDAREHLDA